ncbi:hypothetical protein [Methyloprofundus sp.]|uniref:hypothetical protein n=1 Tax=Methyloprofundus sp. TaxID=2020875 RepID=UPI003D0CCA95
MSFKTSLAKVAIKLTPNRLIMWVANIILKDIAALTAFSFDIDTRKSYVQIQLVGESETIDVWLEDFAITKDNGNYHMLIQHAKSNRVWLDNLLSRVANKAWRIPAPPQLANHIDFLAELFKPESQQLDHS